MSVFSSVDAQPDPSLLVGYLDLIARAAAGMKHYAVAAHALHQPDGLVLDLGCGAGHDLVLLASAGLRPVGVDASAFMLATAAGRRGTEHVPLVQSAGEALPFLDNTLAGCRIERVLMHVVDPLAVLVEVVRCLRPGALITVYEPNWDSFLVRSDHGNEAVDWIAPSRHPGIGGKLWGLIEEAGCDVLDRVEELSVWRSLAVLDRVVGLEASVVRAVDARRVSRVEADRWVAEQRGRESRAEFRSTISKVLIVARKR